MKERDNPHRAGLWWQLYRIWRRFQVEMTTNVAQSGWHVLTALLALSIAAASVCVALALGPAIDSSVEGFTAAALGSAQRLILRPMGGSQSGSHPIRLTYDDELALRAQFSNVAVFRGRCVQKSTVRWKGRSVEAYVRGVEPPSGDNMLIIGGRDLNASDLAGRRLVCVLSKDLADKLAGLADPVGHQVVVGSVPFTVVGVEHSAVRTQGAAGRKDLALYIPLTTLLTRISRSARLTGLQVDVAENIDPVGVEKRLRKFLRKRQRIPADGPEGFIVYSGRFFRDRFLKATRPLRVGLDIVMIVMSTSGLAIVALVTIAGVGRRAHEIRLKRALGASPLSIHVDFLFWACALGTVAGALGIALARAFTILAPHLDLAPTSFSPWAFFYLTPTAAGGAFLVAIGMSCIATVAAVRVVIRSRTGPSPLGRRHVPRPSFQRESD